MSFDDFNGASYKVLPNLYLVLRERTQILPSGIPYLPLGLQLIAVEMQPILAQIGPLVIRIIEVECVDTDYQPEGVAYALAGWMIQKFHLSVLLPPVYSDRGKNRYVFPSLEKIPLDEDFTKFVKDKGMPT